MDSSHKTLLAIEVWQAKLNYYARLSGEDCLKLHQQYMMWNAISASIGRDKTASCDEDNSGWHSILWKSTQRIYFQHATQYLYLGTIL